MDIISCGFDESIRVWKFDSQDDWDCYSTFNNHKNIVWNVCFTKDAALMASCGEDRSIKVF